MLLQGRSFSLGIRRPLKSSKPNEKSKVTIAIEIIMTRAYEGKMKGTINAGSTGTIPIAIPRGWLAPNCVF